MARKRFEAGAITEGSGLVADRHLVNLRDGSTIQANADEAERGPVQLGNPEIRDAKRRILNRLPQQDASLRQISRATLTKAKDVYRRADKSARENGGELRVVEKSKYVSELTDLTRIAVREMRDQVLRNIESSTKTHLIALRRSLPNKGDLPMARIQELSKDIALEIYRAKTGKSNQNTPQRIAVQGIKLEKRLHDNLDRELRDIPKLEQSTIDPRGANRACVSKNLSRINRTEQNRALHQATVKVADSLGINFFFWRLSAAHKSYGGNEICEVLADSTGADVSIELPLGYTGSVRGLYTKASLPDLPHPNCMCTVELAII